MSETVLFGCCHVLTGDDAETFGDEIFLSALCQVGKMFAVRTMHAMY